MKNNILSKKKVKIMHLILCLNQVSQWIRLNKWDFECNKNNKIHIITLVKISEVHHLFKFSNLKVKIVQLEVQFKWNVYKIKRVSKLQKRIFKIIKSNLNHKAMKCKSHLLDQNSSKQMKKKTSFHLLQRKLKTKILILLVKKPK